MNKVLKKSLHVVLFFCVFGILGFNALLLRRVWNTGSFSGAEKIDNVSKLELTVLTAPDCKDCYDVKSLTTVLKDKPGVEISKESELDYNSFLGKRLVKKYGILRVPTVLVSGDTATIFDVDSFKQNLGTVADDGTLIVTQTPAPYIDVGTGEVHGKFTVVYLTDKSCKECYDPAIHRSALEQLMMKPTEERFVDKDDAEGKELIEKYKIVQLPTIVMQGDLNAYPQLQQVWETVGSIETDGIYVFRESGLKLMGNYYDLNTKKLVKPAPEQAAK